MHNKRLIKAEFFHEAMKKRRNILYIYTYDLTKPSQFLALNSDNIDQYSVHVYIDVKKREGKNQYPLFGDRYTVARARLTNVLNIHMYKHFKNDSMLINWSTLYCAIINEGVFCFIPKTGKSSLKTRRAHPKNVKVQVLKKSLYVSSSSSSLFGTPAILYAMFHNTILSDL